MASLSIFLPSALANHATDYSIVLDSFSYDSPNNRSVYTWKLTTVGDAAGVSHVVIDTCLGNTAHSTGGSPDSSGTYSNPDPSTGSNGYKWETPEADLPVGSTFILRFTGNYGQTGQAPWTIKKGPTGHEKDGFAAGPNCTPKTTPTMTTTSNPNSTTVQPGTQVTDSVTVSGAPVPAGTVTFYLCAPNDVTAGGCESGGTQVSTETLTGGAATSDPQSPTAPGKYCWRAEYTPDTDSGSLYNPASHTNNATECFTVASPPAKTTPTMTTTSTPNSTTVQPGTQATDAVTVSGTPVPTGSVTFYLCAPNEVTAGGCESGGTEVSTETLTGGAATSDPQSPTAPGKYCWRAEYTPGADPNYNSANHTNNGTECFTVASPPAKTTPTITTTSNPNSTTVPPGTSVTDTATVSGAAGATGKVYFYLCGPAALPDGCETETNQIGSPKTLTAGTATSETAQPTDAGRYCWRAKYDPENDPNYYGASHTNSNTECFEVAADGEPGPSEKKDPDISTTSSEQGTVPPGTEVTDHVEVSGDDGTPTGDVTFYLCGPGASDGCRGSDDPQEVDEQELDDGEATSDPVAPEEPGRYCWRVGYQGDSTYESDSHTNNTTECFTVASSSSSTPGTEVLGTKVIAGGGGADTNVEASALPKSGATVPVFPAIVLAINLLVSGGMIRKLAILEELEKTKVTPPAV